MKYIIFDFGKVLGYPKTGAWFITPKFLELVHDIDLDILSINMSYKESKL